MTRRDYLEVGSAPVLGLLCCGSALALQVSLRSYGGAWPLWSVGFLFLVLLAVVESWHLQGTGVPTARWLGFSGIGAATIVLAAVADDFGSEMAVGKSWNSIRPFISAAILGALFGTVQAAGLKAAPVARRLAWIAANAFALASTGIALSSEGDSMSAVLAIAVGILLPGGILLLTLRHFRALPVAGSPAAP